MSGDFCVKCDKSLSAYCQTARERAKEGVPHA